MKLVTVEWIEKAEADFATANRELRARKTPNYDAACFHAQQCAEKYIKARLAEAEAHITRIHDLIALLDQVLSLEPAWELHREDLARLTAFAVTFRYPGESADKRTARKAVDMCSRFRTTARVSLGL